MHPIGIVGSGGDTAPALVERLAERLAEAGPTATVTRGAAPTNDGGQYLDAGAAAAYQVSDTGWCVTAEEPDARDLLEELAPAYDYAVFAGFPEADIPQVVLDGADHDGSTLLTADSAEDVDVDAAVGALEDAEPFETLASLVARAKASPEAPKSGAIATFTGRVRAKEDDDDTPTEYLEFEQYDEVAADRFDGIRTDLEARDGVFEVIMHHRTGVVPYGDDIVFVVVLAGHRDEAFATVEDGINRLKAEVPIFKKEVTVAEEFWAHQ
jgi:molybdopterin synthase catalytic subunit